MIDVPTNNSVCKLADWFELYICLNAVGVSKSDITNIIEDELGSVSEDVVDGVVTEMERRERLYGGSVPFSVNGNNIETDENFDWRSFPEYVMCLIYSIRGVITPDTGTKLFEQLSDEALKKYINGETMLLGFPSGRSFDSKLVALASQSNEHYASRPGPHDKDKGVDVIGWIPHGDNRSSQVVILMQSGAGKRWLDKERIMTDLWSRLMWWASPALPALAVPEIIEEGKWKKTTDKFYLVLDRARLIRHIAAIASPNIQLKQDILVWCDIQLA